MAGIGHNTASHDQIKSIVDRIEHLEDEKSGIASDIKDIYAEAKGNGFDVKALRDVIRLRKQEAEKREAHEAIVETYKAALGMFADTDLGKAAIERVELRA